MNQKVLTIAHRGACSRFPENSRSSFLEALRLGADMVEFDVHRTKDGHLVVIHDNKIDRTSNGKGKVTKKSLEELKNYSFGEEKILTLREALETLQEKCNILVELKDSMKGYEHLALAEIKKFSASNHILLQSKNKSILRNVRKLDSQIELGYVFLFSLPYFSLFYHRLLIRKYKLSFLSLHGNLTNKRYLKKFMPFLKEWGINIFIWTINDKDSLNNYLSWGADGIITNNPELLSKY